MPLLGFGVFQNYDATPGCLEAFKAGYRSSIISAICPCNTWLISEVGVVKQTCWFRSSLSQRSSSWPSRAGERAEKRRFVHKSVCSLWQWGISRADDLWNGLATKCVSGSHGYENTLRGVDVSLQRFGFGEWFIYRFCWKRLAGSTFCLLKCDRLYRPFLDTRSDVGERSSFGDISSSPRLQESGKNQIRRSFQLVRTLHNSLLRICVLIQLSLSGVHHLEEIREAGLETPSVNQFEVYRGVYQNDYFGINLTFIFSFIHSASRSRSWNIAKITT